MDPDKYQQAWQAQASQTRVTVDADLLLKEVQRNQRDFRATILRRDIIEVGIGLLLLPYWFYKGATSSQPWTWYLTVPAIIWVIGFFLVDRIRHPQKPSDPDEPLLECAKNSLTQVEHQIWLLRNVFWWYLLPFTIAILTFFADVAWSVSEVWWEALGVATPFFVFLVVLYSFLDYLNQRAVRVDLGPRRQELLGLIATLGGESSTGELATTDRTNSVERSGVLRRWLLVTATCFATFLLMTFAGGRTNSHYSGPPQSSGPGGDSLARMVTELRQEKNLVGLAAMVLVDGQVEAAAAHGERQIGSGVPLEISDRWHLGGITKPITATMIARLIESGQLQWTGTVAEIFPEASVHEEWQQVTLRQLLTDTAGAPANFPDEVSRNHPPLGPESTQARREAVLDVIADQPAYPPGREVANSNVGYTIAGAMAEKVTGDTWEALVKREVFEPLELTEAGFGPPKSADESLPQPRGHRTRLAGKVAEDDDADNTFIMGPAGIVHMSLRDLCTFAWEHLQGERALGKLLSDEMYNRLHAPEFNYYACGWVVKEPSSDIPYTVYWHNGTNTLWYALVVFIPERNTVIAVASNDGDFDSAEAAAWEIVKASVSFPKKSPFAAVRWQQSQPEVKVGDQWYKLVSLDDLPAEEIVAFSRKTYGNNWRKRFAEDLVELLTRMGHPPPDEVTLVVQSLTTSETRIFERVAMTEANRRAIYSAAEKLSPSEPQHEPETRTPVPIENTEQFRERVGDERHRSGTDHPPAIGVPRR